MFSIYFMPEGGRTSSPSLDSTDGRVDSPPPKHFGRMETPPPVLPGAAFSDPPNYSSTHSDFASPNTCVVDPSLSLSYQFDGMAFNPLVNPAHCGFVSFPPTTLPPPVPTIIQDGQLGASVLGPLSFPPNFNHPPPPPPPPSLSQCPPIPPISFIAPPFPPPLFGGPPSHPPPVLPPTSTASLSRPTNCRFLSNETISKWISTGEEAMSEQSNSGFVSGPCGGKTHGKMETDSRGGNWK